MDGGLELVARGQKFSPLNVVVRFNTLLSVDGAVYGQNQVTEGW